MLATVYRALRPDNRDHGRKPSQEGHRDAQAADGEDPDSGSEALSVALANVDDDTTSWTWATSLLMKIDSIC